MPYAIVIKKVIGMFELLLGSGKSGAPVTLVDKWDKDWLTLPYSVSGHCSAIVGNKLYIYGGTINSAISGRLLEIDLDTKAIVEKTPTTAIRFAAAVAVNGLIYVYGGFTTTYTGMIRIYNPATDTWASGGIDGVACDRFGWSAKDGVIYASGGTNGANVGTIRTYNIATRLWNNSWAGSAPVALGTRSVINKDSLYTYGGYQIPTTTQFNRYLTGASNNVQNLPGTPSPQFLHVMSTGKDGIYVFGGTTDVAAQADKTLRCDLTSLKWVEMAPLGASIGAAASAATTTDNIVYISGGQGAGGGNKVHRYRI